MSNNDTHLTDLEELHGANAQIIEECYDLAVSCLRKEQVSEAIRYFKLTRRQILTSDIYEYEQRLTATGVNGQEWGDHIRKILQKTEKKLLELLAGLDQSQPYAKLALLIVLDADNYISFYPNLVKRKNWEDKREEDKYTDYSYDCARYSMFKANRLLDKIQENDMAQKNVNQITEALTEYYSQLPWGKPILNKSLFLNGINEVWQEYYKCEREIPESEDPKDERATISVFSRIASESLKENVRNKVFRSMWEYGDPTFWDNAGKEIKKMNSFN